MMGVPTPLPQPGPAEGPPAVPTARSRSPWLQKGPSKAEMLQLQL